MPTSVEALANEARADGAGAEEVSLEIARIKIGGWTVAGLAGLIVLAAALIFVYAAKTFPPTAAEFKTFLDSTAQEAQKAHDDRHLAWLGEVKDLAQIWIVALLIPLLSTVIGYIFGKSTAEGSEG